MGAKTAGAATVSIVGTGIPDNLSLPGRFPTGPDRDEVDNALRALRPGAPSMRAPMYERGNDDGFVGHVATLARAGATLPLDKARECFAALAGYVAGIDHALSKPLSGAEGAAIKALVGGGRVAEEELLKAHEHVRGTGEHEVRIPMTVSLKLAREVLAGSPDLFWKFVEARTGRDHEWNLSSSSHRNFADAIREVCARAARPCSEREVEYFSMMLGISAILRGQDATEGRDRDVTHARSLQEVASERLCEVVNEGSGPVRERAISALLISLRQPHGTRAYNVVETLGKSGDPRFQEAVCALADEWANAGAKNSTAEPGWTARIIATERGWWPKTASFRRAEGTQAAAEALSTRLDLGLLRRSEIPLLAVILSCSSSEYDSARTTALRVRHRPRARWIGSWRQERRIC